MHISVNCYSNAPRLLQTDGFIVSFEVSQWCSCGCCNARFIAPGFLKEDVDLGPLKEHADLEPLKMTVTCSLNLSIGKCLPTVTS